jgi:hypothetical protein
LENAVLKALERHLMRDDMVKVFCEEYQKKLNQLRSQQKSSLSKMKAKLAKLDKEKAHIMQAIKDGLPAELIKDELKNVSKRQDELKILIENQSTDIRPIFLLPYRLDTRKTGRL